MKQNNHLSSPPNDLSPFSGGVIDDLIRGINKNVYSIAVRCYNCDERQVLVIPKGQPVGGKCRNCGCTTLSKV